MLFDRFEKKFIPVPESGCWLWTGAVDDCGYGRIAVNKINKTAHRISWPLHKGDIPKNMCVCHVCDVPSCVNPNHLFLGTHASNMKDRDEKERGYVPHGTQHWKCKLKETEVIKIFNDPRHRTEIANDYSITKENVTAIKSGRNWKYLHLKHTKHFLKENLK